MTENLKHKYVKYLKSLDHNAKKGKKHIKEDEIYYVMHHNAGNGLIKLANPITLEPIKNTYSHKLFIRVDNPNKVFEKAEYKKPEKSERPETPKDRLRVGNYVYMSIRDLIYKIILIGEFDVVVQSHNKRIHTINRDAFYETTRPISKTEYLFHSLEKVLSKHKDLPSEVIDEIHKIKRVLLLENDNLHSKKNK